MPNLNVKPQARPSLIGRRVFRPILSVAILLALAIPLCTARAQLRTGQDTRLGQQTPQMGIPPSIDSNANFRARRIRQLNIERQKELVSDTDDLLKLTAKLNAEVAKSQSSSLTPDQVRMLAKIEKLAKSVREKMSNPVTGSVFEDNFPPPMGRPTIP